MSTVFVYTQLNVKTVLFQTIQSSKSTHFKYQNFYFEQFSLALVQFSSIWLIDMTPSGAIAPSQSGTGSDGNKGVLRIPQSSSIARASPSDYSMSSPRHSLGESHPSTEMQSVYSAAPADQAIHILSEITWTIWLLYYNNMCLHLSHIKSFCGSFGFTQPGRLSL